MQIDKSSEIISKIVFVFTLGISCFSFIPVIFPKLLLNLVNDYGMSSDAYEFGGNASLIFINLFIVSLLLFFRYRKSPRLLTFLESLSKFDISKRTTVILLTIIFTIYIYFSWDELFSDESVLQDYYAVISGIQNLQLIDPDGHWNFFFLRYVLLKISNDILGNIHFLPFISSCALLFFTYLFTKEISKKRFTGIIAMTVLLQSNLFLLFDSIATYETFWITFYLISIYLILKRIRLSFIPYLISMSTKAVSAIFLPISLFLISQSNFSDKIKVQSILIYVIPFVTFVIVAHFFGILDFSTYTNTKTRDFWTSVSSFAIATRFDGLILSIFFPTLITLYFKSKKYKDYSTFLLFSISILLVMPWILHFFLAYTNQPYRLVSLITFIAIAFGTLFSNESLRSK